MTKADLEEARALARKARDWIATSEAQAQIAEALNHATKVSTQLDELRRVDLEKLHEPFTV